VAKKTIEVPAASVPQSTRCNADSLTTAFAGSPAFAAAILRCLVASAYRPQLVLTQPDRPKGRGRKLAPNAVKMLADDLGLPVEQPISLKKPDATATLESLEIDVLIVAAYGLILPPAVLQIPRYGCLNVHASLLPRWRGAAPIERAMMAGDELTGIAIMQMERGLDTGPVFAIGDTPINDTDSAQSIEARLADLGCTLLLGVLDEFAQAKLGKTTPPKPVAQDASFATYAAKLTNLDRDVDWTLDARQLARRVRALADRIPVTVQRDNLRVQILAAGAVSTSTGNLPGTIVHTDNNGIVVQCARGGLQIKTLRLNRGKGKPMDAAQALNGYADEFAVGVILSKANGII
jgi:methionyl-tRNA formyltransferase